MGSHTHGRRTKGLDYSLAVPAALIIKFILKFVFKYVRYPPNGSLGEEKVESCYLVTDMAIRNKRCDRGVCYAIAI
jgi:hypothetical protein